MKKITQKLLFVTLAASVFLASCGDDDEETLPAIPTINVSATVNNESIESGDEVEVGSTIMFRVDITAAGGVNTLWIGDDPVDRATLNVDAGATSATYSFNSDVTQEGMLSLEIYAVDDEDQSSAITTFSVTGVITSPDAKVQTAKMLLAPTGDFTSDTFYSIAQDQLYSSNDVTSTEDPISTNIDLGYYYRNNDMTSIAAPANYPTDVYDLELLEWNIRNATELVKTTLTQEAYMALSTVADVEAELANVDFTSSTGRATELTEEDVIAFNTVNNLSGFILVTEISGTANQGDFIELEFLLAEAATTEE